MAEEAKGQRFSQRAGGFLDKITGSQGAQQTQQTQQQTSGQQSTGGVFLPGISNNQNLINSNKVSMNNGFTQGIQDGTIKSNIVLPGITSKPNEATLDTTTMKQKRQSYIYAKNNNINTKSINEQIEEERTGSNKVLGQTGKILKTYREAPINNFKKRGMRAIADSGLPGYFVDKTLEKAGAPDGLGDSIKDAVNETARKVALTYQNKVNEDFQKKVDKNIDARIREKYDNESITDLIGKGDGAGARYKIWKGTVENWNMIPEIGLMFVNPYVGLTAMGTDVYIQENQGTFEDMLQNGATYEQAKNGAVAVGILNAGIELFMERFLGGAKWAGATALRRLFLKNAQREVVKQATKKGMAEIFARGVSERLKGSMVEGFEEVLQQITGNIMVKMVNPDRDITEGARESFEGGFYNLFNAIGGATNIANEFKQNEQIQRNADIEALKYVAEGEQRKAQRMAREKARARFLERVKNPTMDNGYTPTPEQAQQRATEKEENEQFEDELRAEQNRETQIENDMLNEVLDEGDINEDLGDPRYQKNGDTVRSSDQQEAGGLRIDSSSTTPKVTITKENSSDYTTKLDEIKKDLEGLKADTFLERIKNSISGDQKTNYIINRNTNRKYVLRISSHHANAYNARGNKAGTTSIVIKLMDNPKFKKDNKVNLVEFVYNPENMTPATMQGIIEGIQNWIQTGQYTDMNFDAKNESTRKKGDKKYQLKYEEEGYTPGVAKKDEKNISGKSGKMLKDFLKGQTIEELAKKYGVERIDVVKGLVDGMAYGSYSNRILRLAEEIKESTAPHELLHLVFDMVDPETKTYLISQVMQSEGWSAEKAEEWLADSFSNFYRTGKIESAPKSTWGKIKIFFKRVRSFINGMWKWRNQLEQMFTDIIESSGIEELQGKIDSNKEINKSKAKMRKRFLEYRRNAEKTQAESTRKTPENWEKNVSKKQIADESVYELQPLERIEQMEKLILDEYGTTDEPTRVAFIDNKGRWINGNMSGYGNYRDTDHREIAQTAFDDTDIEFNNATDGLVALQAQTGLVRVNLSDGYMNIDTVYELMPSQREGLMRFDDEDIKEIYVDITHPQTGKIIESKTFASVRDAVRWIDRHFADSGNKYQKVEREDDRMIALHNISLEKLAKAKDLGGLVAPSIGITKSGIPFENYGEISFIANKDLVNPSKDVIVGETDLYTPRVPQPTLEWKDNVNREKQEEIAKKVGMEMGELYDYVTGYSQSHWERMYPNLAKEIAPYINKTLFKGFTEMGDRIYQPYTMKNILNDMFNKGDVGEESAMFQGNLSEAMARMSDDVKDLENVRGKIGNREGLDKEYDALSDKYTDLGWDTLEGREGMAIFSENIRKSNKDIVAELADFDIEVTEKQVQELKDIVMEALKLPKSYVEAKIKRGVRFDEFSAVVVPEDKVAEVRDLIGDEIEIFGYKPGDRMNVINEVADSKGVKFQRAGDINSPAFKKRFGDSKVVDENGNPLVVYHGTEMKFNTFGRGNGEHGKGFYFTDDMDYAEEFSGEDGNTMEVYLKMVKPLRENVDMNSPEMKNLIKGIKDKRGLSEKEIKDCFGNEDWSSELSSKIAKKMGYGKKDVEKTVGWEFEDIDDIGETDYNAYLGAYAWENGLNDLVRESGFDGIISKIYNSDAEGLEYIAFKPNQVKSATDNVGTYDINNDDIRYQRVYHGSPNEFDRFDSSHMGEGEGAQAHGRGHYVAVDPETARRYAQEPFRKNEVEIKGKTMTRTEDVWDIPYALRTLYRDLYSFFSFGYYDFDTEIDNAINQIKKEYQDTVDYYKKLIEDKTIPVGVDGVDLEKLQEDRKKSLKEFEDALEFIEGLNPEDVIVRELNNRRNFYEVEIPDPVKADTPTGKNYIEEENRIGVRAFNRMLKRFEKDGREVENGYGNYTVKKGDDEITLTNPNNTWKQLIREDIENPKLFSQILNRMGYNGIHYYGGVDGEAYVIFNDNDLEIKNHEKYQKVEYEYDEDGKPKWIKFDEDNSERDPSIFGEPSREEQIADDKENEKNNPFYNAWIKYNNQNYKDDQLTFEEFIQGISERGDKEQAEYNKKLSDISEAQNDPQLLDLQLRAVKLMEEEGNVGKKFGKNVSKEVRDRQQKEVESKREQLISDIVDYMYPGLKTEEITYDMQKEADQKEAEREMLGREDLEEKLKYFKKDKNGNREAKEVKIENPDIKLDKILSAGKFEEIFTPLDRVIEWRTPQGQHGVIDNQKNPKQYKSVMEKINAGKIKTKVTLKDVTRDYRALEKYKADQEAEKARKKKERDEAYAKKKQEEYKKIVRMKAFQRLVDMQRFEKYPFLTEEEIKNRYGFTDEEWKKITEQEEIKLPKKRGEKAISDLNKAVDSQVKALIEGLSWQNNLKRKDAEKNLGEIGEIDVDILLGRDEEKGQKEVEEFEKLAKDKGEDTTKKRLKEAQENIMDVEIDKERENSKSERERIDKLIKSTKTDKTVRGSVKKFTSDIITPVSTKIKEISPKIYREVMRYFQNKDILTNQRLKNIDPFLKALGKIKKENPVRFMDVRVALANRNIGYANGLLKEYGVTVPTKLLDEIYVEADDVGLNINYLGSYYPLSVKAPKSFLEELMKVDKGDIASEIEKRIQKESQKKGGPLEESEITAIINDVIAGGDKGPDINTGNKHLKKRNTEIKRTPKMLEYCDDPISTLITYIEGMTQSIERAKFLGKSRSGNVHTLADYVYNAKNGLTPDQQDDLMDLLKAVFNDESPNKFVQTWRDLGTLTTLGSPSSTLTQLGDLSFSVYENGWKEALKAVWDVFSDKKVFNLEDMGVINRGEEYTNINSQKNLLQKAIHNVFKLTFFSNFDTFGKSTFIQSTWNKRRKRSLKGEHGDSQLRKDIMKWADDEYMTDKIIEDLRKGVFSQDVALVMYMKLGNIQPLTKAQMPKAYLNNPNGRLFYQFKTFGIKQLDYVLQETKENTKNFKNLSTMDKMLKIAQIANMVFIMTLLGVGADELKDITMRRRSNSLILRWLFGENVGSEQIWEKMEDNVLKLFGLSRYTIMQMKNDPVDAITSLFTTLPATNLVNYPFKDIYKAFKDGSINWRNPASYQLIPVVGKYRYWIYGGGQDKQQQALDKENKKSTKKKSSGSTRKPLKR